MSSPISLLPLPHARPARLLPSLFLPQSPFHFHTVPQLLSLVPPKPLIGGMMHEGGIYAVFAPPGVGKSLLEQHLALSVALGRPVHGHSTTAGPVVRVLPERYYLAQQRLRAWATIHHPAGGLGGHIPVFSTPTALQLDDVASLDRFITALRDAGIQPKLILLDTLQANALGVDENGTGAMSEVMAGMRYLQTALDTTVFITHHTGKSGKSERGSTVIRAAVDGMWKLSRATSPGQLVLRCVKVNAGPAFPPQCYEIRTAADSAALVEVGTGNATQSAAGTTSRPAAAPAATEPSLRERIIAVVCASPSPLSRTAILHGVLADGHSARSRTHVSNLVGKMLTGGTLVADASGRLITGVGGAVGGAVTTP